MVFMFGDFLIAREDPELIERAGKKFCKCTLCFSKPMKDANGAWQNKRTFINAFANGTDADKLAKCHKGDVVNVMGEPWSGGKYTGKDGVERTAGLMMSITRLLCISDKFKSQAASEDEVPMDVGDLPF